jgi:hypothetical protein
MSLSDTKFLRGSGGVGRVWGDSTSAFEKFREVMGASSFSFVFLVG